jgi:hypothetical protein
MRIGQPDHQPRATDFVHRRLLVRRHVDAQHRYRLVLKRDIAYSWRPLRL